MENSNNSGKFALITGASSGIGYELAKLFAKDNYNLVLVARNEENLKQAATDMKQVSNIEVHTISADLFQHGAAKEVYNKVKGLGITIDVLVNDAGQGEWGRFHKTNLDREIDLVHLNIMSLMSFTKFYLQEMVERNSGKILQLASSLAKAPSPYFAVYAATKAFVLSFSEALVKELEETDVTVTALLPGATDTDFFHKAKAENTVTYKETSLYDPAEVAKAGYDGLMNGDATVVPGAMNKMDGILGAILPDSAVASKMEKQLVSSMDENGRAGITHEVSARVRAKMNSETGGVNGDVSTAMPK
ncbi:MAG: SDR family oxidoreductase [Flavobacterium sp.]|nr:MAG: SDR family oxidoreductase [Flavobacterium sp.]